MQPGSVGRFILVVALTLVAGCATLTVAVADVERTSNPNLSSLDQAGQSGVEQNPAAFPTAISSPPVATVTPPPGSGAGPAIERALPEPPSERALRVVEPDSGPTWFPAEMMQRQWSDAVPGVLTFRGSPSRDFYGSAAPRSQPTVRWSYPDVAMCSVSTDESGARQWCGTGWTGQPAVWERAGQLWMAFGALDRRVHVLDALTGEPRMEPFETGDIIKGSLTVDPDGHPLLYVGSRDNFLRVLAFDGGQLRELWSLDARSITPRLWNDDWDGAPVVLDDHLFVGGENSNFHVVRLNRGYASDGSVMVAPELLAVLPGWDDELLAAVGDNVSIESSVTVVDDVAWFANSGGLVQAVDLAPIRDGRQPERVFRFWIGDDTDATVVLDDDGIVYAASQYERATDRSKSLGQIVSLDPSRPEDPLIWSIDVDPAPGSGVWATPALYQNLLIVTIADGRVLGIDRASGDMVWSVELPGPLWSSPVVVDDVLIQADCAGGVHAWSLAGPTAQPEPLWSVDLAGCIESTPTIWNESIWVGTRGGLMYRLAVAE